MFVLHVVYEFVCVCVCVCVCACVLLGGGECKLLCVHMWRPGEDLLGVLLYCLFPPERGFH
jgi:Flp pilus assembly protein protease CpaA